MVDIGILLLPFLFILLYLAGFVLSIAYWRRCRPACGFLLLASLFNLGEWSLRFGLTYLVQADLRLAGREDLMSVSLFSILNWVAYGFMLLAVFAGRHERPAAEPAPPPDVDGDEWGAPPPSMANPTGIRTAPGRRPWEQDHSP